MVRILSCHHFRGQRIGRCEEAVAIAVAGDAVIVGLENQINVYGSSPRHSPVDGGVPSDTPPPPLPGPGTTTLSAPNPSGLTHLRNHDLGTSYVFLQPKSSPAPGRLQAGQTPVPPTPSKVEAEFAESDSDLRLSHSFATVDCVHEVSYNEKGKYILCLERRDHASAIASVRTYFYWERDHGTRPMRARIAGLVSPTGAEPEEESLMMVEIPMTSPATAVGSCNLTGHVACLSAESIVHLFLFRAKEVTGRVKVHYFDFDRTYAIELPGFVPERVCFLSNYVACMSAHKIQVFRVSKGDKSGSPPPATVAPERQQVTQMEQLDKVVFDAKNESIKVYLPSIGRANRKRRGQTNAINEEFKEDINSKHAKLVFNATNSDLIVEDILRLGVGSSGKTSTKFVGVKLYPVRIKDHLGAVSLIACTEKAGYLYHLPAKRHSHAVHTTTYHFTASLIGFTFDGFYFHALTETGLESYTSRSLYYAMKDMQGLKTFSNDCPLCDEPPNLVGIRPFVNIKKIVGNATNLSMLASSTVSKNGPQTSSQSTEEQSWTIYSLSLPDIDTIYDDIMRTALLQMESNPEGYLTLLCEGFIVLRLFIEANPELEVVWMQRYKEICKRIGLAYLKSAVVSYSGSTDSNDPAVSRNASKENSAIVQVDIMKDLLDRGVTYLLMGRCGVQEIFSPENWNCVREPHYIPGFVRLVEVTFLKSEEDISIENQKLSPTLSPVVVEFLANNGPHILVDLVIHAPFIRECNSKRLLQILQHIAETKQYSPKETMACLLTLVTVGGVDFNTRSQINELLHKCSVQELETLISKSVLLESKGNQTSLTDVAVCLGASDYPQLLAYKLVQFLNRGEVTISLVMVAFAQALNVNTDIAIQHSLTKCLTNVTEFYVSENLARSRVTSTIDFPEEEKRAIHLLVRTYLANINFSSSVAQKVEEAEHHQSPDADQKTATEQEDNSSSEKPPASDALKQNQIFGSVCTCVNFLLSMNSPGGAQTPQSQSLNTAPVFVNEESRENFIKLLSLLSNHVLSNVDGVKEIVVTYLYRNVTNVKPNVNSTLHLILQILAESTENSINILLTKQPTTVMLFAKEVFEKDPKKWKVLVANLKNKIQQANQENQAEVEIYSTILESVYLHVANTLTPAELELVLDKGAEENVKFHGICKRVELANNFANMVITVSSNYLDNK